MSLFGEKVKRPKDKKYFLQGTFRFLVRVVELYYIKNKQMNLLIRNIIAIAYCSFKHTSQRVDKRSQLTISNNRKYI